MNKTYEINLSYFKRGDDLAHCLAEYPNSPVEALQMHVGLMDENAQLLTRILTVIQGVEGVTLEGDCHMTQITGPQSVLDPLVTSGDLVVQECTGEEDGTDMQD